MLLFKLKMYVRNIVQKRNTTVVCYNKTLQKQLWYEALNVIKEVTYCTMDVNVLLDQRGAQLVLKDILKRGRTRYFSTNYSTRKPSDVFQTQSYLSVWDILTLLSDSPFYLYFNLELLCALSVRIHQSHLS